MACNSQIASRFLAFIIVMVLIKEEVQYAQNAKTDYVPGAGTHIPDSYTSHLVMWFTKHHYF
jgi:hypothetical protein